MTNASVQPGGSNRIADIQGRGFPGFKLYKAEYAGGRAFNLQRLDRARQPHQGRDRGREPSAARAAV